ncbi:uncharacterized protein OGAPODRAFT_74412 [Ogataea polymorpha]|uniref:uncharacterized protein n=1 Tax=Ogataea polymorpha TaxID=460523 RepID=UPI0007F51E6B|nr:uncharacterized protein OGAPODRAFT_74412 [Ogataea polymorpha]KAG7930277.1 hypothetical protein KL934_004971 [Ogataea polymorpha]OBA18148.1 hypothetical protein OGAPODRAFT_74412 [Ogataea polymorpha]
MEPHKSPTGTKGSRKSTHEELLAASQAVEQEINAVKALKRLSIGNNLSYDPDLPYSESEKLDFDIIDIHNDKENQTPVDDELDQDHVLPDANKFMWVPATAHPQLAPEKFRKHVQATVDEITSKLQRSASSRSSLSHETRDSQTDLEKPTEPNRTDTGLHRKPSIKQLTKELESLSQMAGLDDTDAVTLARTLSSSSWKLKENFDTVSSLSRKSSASSVDSELDLPGTQLKRSKWTTYRRGSRSSRATPQSPHILANSSPSAFPDHLKSKTLPHTHSSKAAMSSAPTSAAVSPEILPPVSSKAPTSSLPPLPVEKNSPLPPLPKEQPVQTAPPVKSPPQTPEKPIEQKTSRKSSWTWLSGNKDKEKKEKERSPPNHSRNRHGTASDVVSIQNVESPLPSPPREQEKEKKSLSGFFKLKKDKPKSTEKSAPPETLSDSDNESITDKRILNLRKKKEEPQQEHVAKQPRPAVQQHPPPIADSPLDAVSENIKQTLMSQRRNTKPNQPLQMTDSAFGFPLPPISPSTLVMLNHRFPIHVERAVYRLSHLKLSDPKRPLCQQVLLSNFMYAYLNLVNHTLFLQQQEETYAQPVEEDNFVEPVEEYAFDDVYGGYTEEVVYEH